MIVRARAPLRLGLAGGGTDLSPYCDLYGGCVLNATIDLYAYAHIVETSGRKIRFSAPDIDEEFSTEAQSRLETTGPLALHKAVYNRIVNDYCGGKPLSQQDQYAATFGGFNFMEFYAEERTIVNPLHVKNWILSELESSLVLYFTGVSRISSAIIDEQTKNVQEHDPSSIEAMNVLKRDAIGMKEAVLKGDFERFAHYIGTSWEAKKHTARGISTPRIERVFDLAMGAGAKAGKVSGAGGGGFIMFVVDPARRTAVVQALQRGDGEVKNCHFTKGGTEGWRLD